MSALSNFLYSCLPEADYALLEPMLTRFNQDYVDDAFPSLQKPFKLSSAEVAILIELAIKNHSERLLVALASMGTVELMLDNTIKDPVEPLIGQRDSTIETALIAKALALQSAKEKDKERPCRYVYGLSGNPPTLNHLHFIEHLVRDGEATVVLNAQSPLKALDSYVEPNLRFDMLHLMIDSLDEYSKSRCTLSRLEIDRPPPSRMVVTMSLLTLLAQKDEQLTLVLGLDALPLFTKWYQWEALGRLCALKFYPRSTELLSHADLDHYLKLLEAGGVHKTHLVFQTETECALFRSTYPGRKASVEVIPNLSDGSASLIREHYLKKGAATAPPPQDVHPGVHGLIERYGLFREHSPLLATTARQCTDSASPCPKK